MSDAKFEDLFGETLVSIEGGIGDDELRFTTAEGAVYLLHHEKDCCEDVRVEDICGDLDDLIGLPLLQAYESSDGSDEEYWTFYHLATERGRVTLRWLGQGNGYYSLAVDIRKYDPPARRDLGND